jgi:integrase
MPNSKGRRRRFGAVRELPSGQFQARYKGEDGTTHAADRTFPTQTDADVWLTLKEAEIRSGDWINPDHGKVLFGKYAADWIEERPNLRPKTVTLYRYLLRTHLASFSGKTVAEIREGNVRTWRKKVLDSGVSEVTTAKAYRLLKAVLNTAADDGLIRRNPCRIKGAAAEDSPERPVLTIAEVYALADAIDRRYRTFVLLGAFASLRWAELAALRRCDIDLVNLTIRVERQLTTTRDGKPTFGPPKSKAGVRTVAIPRVIEADVCEHLAIHVGQDDDALVFASPGGLPLNYSNFHDRFWAKAVEKAGPPGIHFHDLRHAGNTLTANAGANLKELMDRMGHSTTRAALIYLHSTSERQRTIADAIDKQARAELRKIKKSAKPKTPSGTEVARPTEQAS